MVLCVCESPILTRVVIPWSVVYRCSGPHPHKLIEYSLSSRVEEERVEASVHSLPLLQFLQLLLF